MQIENVRSMPRMIVAATTSAMLAIRWDNSRRMGTHELSVLLELFCNLWSRVELSCLFKTQGKKHAYKIFNTSEGFLEWNSQF